jgi:RNA polymerase sigma-70 factor (ECF subfamily)
VSSIVVQQAQERFMTAAAAARVDLPETELCRRLACGDARALERLMRLHNQRLYRAARAILRDDAEAEDVVQETYLRAYRGMHLFRGEAALSTWLVRICVHEALQRRRKARRRGEVMPIRPGLTAAEIDAQALAPRGDPTLAAAESGELRRRIEARIDALPDAFREVFVLRALEELSVEETAAVLGLPPVTVRTRFFRARSRLREALSREEDATLGEAFAFAGERCDRIVAGVLCRLLARASGLASP